MAAAVTAGLGDWVPAPDGDGLSVDHNGTIYVPGLRDGGSLIGGSGITYFVQVTQAPFTGSPATGGGGVSVSLVANDIRMSVAVPCDHRMMAVVKSANDPLKFGLTDSNPANDTDLIAKEFQRVYHCDAGHLYRKEYRQSGQFLSWPIPESVPKQTKFPGGIIFDDTALLQNDCVKKAREMLRLDRGGESLGTPHIIDAANVGDMIEKLTSGGKVRACVQAITYTYDEHSGQRTERHLG